MRRPRRVAPTAALPLQNERCPGPHYFRLLSARGKPYARAVGDITAILQRTNVGDPHAVAELLSLVYDELRGLAAAKMSRNLAPHTLQPTALVHEAWLRLGGAHQPAWQNRRHYFGAAAEAMRQILIERARKRQAVRHGGGQIRVDAAAIERVEANADSDHVLAVAEVLERFAALDPEKAELVKLRYFAGMTLAEAAVALDISGPMAKRWWTFARAWLAREIRRRGQ